MTVLNAHLFGGFELVWSEAPLPPVSASISRSLLAYLILYRSRRHTRDLLVGIFWPDLPEATARRRLSQALWQIQHTLRKALGEDLFLTEGDTIQIHPDLSLWVDVEEFGRLGANRSAWNVPAARQAVLPRVPDLTLLARAVGLYRGDLLAGYYDDWVLIERERLRELFLRILSQLVDGYKQQGDYEQALIYARRLVGEDPWREEGHREVMRLCHLLGRDAEALKQFETCRQVLEDEFGAPPQSETSVLAHEIARHADLQAVPYLPVAAPAPLDGAHQAPGLVTSPLVARRQERAALVAQLEAAASGYGGVVLIAGQAGVGKTRLLRELARDAEWRDVLVLWGHSRDVAGTAPFGPWVEALETDLSPLRVDQWAHLVEPIWLQVLRPLLPALSTVAPDPAPALKPERERDRLINAFAELLAAWGTAVPLLVVIEDLHWADQGSLDLLISLAARLQGHKVLIAGSYRGGEARVRPAVWARLQALQRAGEVERMALDPLDAEATGELIRRSLGASGAAPLFETRIFRETGGNPLFVLEILRALHDEGLLSRGPAGRWRTPWDETTVSYDELPLPSKVEQVIARRLAHLAPGERAVIEMAAVLGAGFDFHLLQAACDRDVGELMPIVHSLVRRQFLVEQPEVYEFGHDQIRYVVYQSLGAEARRAGHLSAAHALEALHPDQAGTLAHHFMQGQVWDRAAEYHRQAAAQAKAVYAHAEAVEHCTQAIEALERMPGPPDPALVFELRKDSETAYAYLGERALQFDELAALHVLAEQLDGDRQRIASDLRHADYYLSTSDLPAARHSLDHAVHLAQEIQDRHGEARAFTSLSRAHLYLGDYEPARAYAEQALAVWQEIGDRFQEARCLGSCCVVCQVSGDFYAAHDYGEQALALSRRIGDRASEGFGHYLLGRIYRDMGKLALARDQARQASEIMRLVGDRNAEAYHLLELGNVHSNLGQYAAARETLENAAAIFQQIDDRRGHGYALLDLAMVYLLTGSDDAARRYVEQGVEMLAGAGDRWGEAGGLTYLGLVCEERGELDAAARTFERALAIKDEIEECALALADYAGLARIALARNDTPRAIEHVDTILDQLARAGITAVERPLLIYLTAYGVLAAAGDVDRADALLAEAYTLLMERAEAIDDDDSHRSFLENVPEHRDLVATYRAQIRDRETRRVTARLAHVDAPLGRPLRDDEYVAVMWTVEAPGDGEVAGKAARRRHRLLRLADEAATQGAAPTVGDLAAALEVSRATLKRDLVALREQGHGVQTRGGRS